LIKLQFNPLHLAGDVLSRVRRGRRFGLIITLELLPSLPAKERELTPPHFYMMFNN